MIKEFKEFIDKGDFVMVAVGLVLALAFNAVVTAFIAGLVTPIIAAILGQPDALQMGFTINGAFFNVGVVLNAIITFMVTAFVLFLVVKAYNKMKDGQPETPTEVELLTEIRDSLARG